MSRFRFYIALDGSGLNGFEGFAGIARLEGDPDRDDYRVDVRFYPGVAGGHATQLSPGESGRRIGFLGNLSQTLLFYDPETLDEVARHSMLRHGAPQVFYESQTHVVWLSDDALVTVIGPDFVKLSLSDLSRPERLGAHRVTLPHAVKRSPSGRYLFYGAMDHDHHGYANQVGIFDLERGEARVVPLPATAWHLGVHPTRDVFYAPSQRCTPQGDLEFAEYTMAHFKNYLFEIDGERAEVTRHLAIPRDLPGFLTSDVVVTEREVLYNCCASGAVARVNLESMREVDYIDERTPLLRSLPYWRSAVSNLVEAVSRVNLPDAWHTFVKSLRITRGSLLDGSYGLQLTPDGRYLLSAHRGRNQVVVYRYPDLEEHARIDFPPLRQFFPEHLGWTADTRLGFHHSAITAA